MRDEELFKIAQNIRKNVLDLAFSAGRKGSHIGGSLSMCEILAVLYFSVMKLDPLHMNDPMRDRFILSKGHGALALYSALKERGVISEEELKSFKYKNSNFWTHPKFMPEKGLEFASGSLGIGISLAAGTAFALKIKNQQNKVFVLLGDGECDEGSVWEAASFIGHHCLSNLTVIIDFNRLQLDGKTEEIINKDNLGDRWRAFGFAPIYADGHDISSLLKAFSVLTEKPKVIIAATVKGKGVTLLENNPISHMSSLSENDYVQAIKVLGSTND